MWTMMRCSCSRRSRSRECTRPWMGRENRLDCELLPGAPMAKDVNADLLAGRWMHSHEEDEGGVKVFRPASFNFPRSRGRESLVLEAGGRLVHGKPGPTDRTERVSGSWELAGDTLTINRPGASPLVYKIVSADKDKLVVKS